jgi:hypothetical protein
MLSFIFAGAFANVIAGRNYDIFGKEVIDGRLLFRCILPAILSASFGYEQAGTELAIYAGLSVLVGSALWYAPNWSFDEITGQYDDKKYLKFIRKIGQRLYPNDGKANSNRKRGIVTKGFRGAYDILTFGLFSLLNPYAILLWLCTFSMGFFYWFAGKIAPPTATVAFGELMYGLFRMFLIGSAIQLAA